MYSDNYIGDIYSYTDHFAIVIRDNMYVTLNDNMDSNVPICYIYDIPILLEI